VKELDKEFVIHAEAPGFEGAEFEVFFSNDVLTLKAEHKVETEGKREGAVCCERYFERDVTLPAGVNSEKIEATYKNGILEVHVPKSEECKPRRVIVKT
jgi:HSP20 family protein